MPLYARADRSVQFEKIREVLALAKLRLGINIEFEHFAAGVCNQAPGPQRLFFHWMLEENCTIGTVTGFKLCGCQSDGGSCRGCFESGLYELRHRRFAALLVTVCRAEIRKCVDAAFI